MRLYELPLNVRLEIQNYMLDNMYDIMKRCNRCWNSAWHVSKNEMKNYQPDIDEMFEHVLELVEKEQEKKHLEELKKIW